VASIIDAADDLGEAGVQSHAPDVQRACGMEARAGLADEADRIHADLAKHFAPAAQVIADAAAAGVQPGMDTQQLRAPGNEVTQHWHKVAAAEQTLTKVRGYFRQAADNPQSDAIKYVEGVADLAIADIQELIDSSPEGWLAAAVNGVSLHLNSDAEVEAIRAELRKRVEQQQREAEA
jgi:hypothetical protein